LNRKFVFDSNCVLRSILNKEDNIDIIKDFIETILDISICEIHYREDLMYEEIFGKYLGIVNVIVTTDKNKKLNVGIQIIDGLYIQNKMILYYAQLYSNITKTITINILDCEFFNSKEYHKIIEIKGFDMDILPKKEKSEIHVLELPKFKNLQIDTKESAWINYFKQNNLDEEIKKKYTKISKLDNLLESYWKEEKM